MSLLLSAQTGEAVTAAELLGEDEPEAESQSEAEARFDRMVKARGL